jgi:GNAT superfamily N-acetyltransferase
LAESWVIEALAPTHDRNPFDCGAIGLNDWLHKLAGQFVRRDLARVYVAVRGNEPRILGYYAISAHHVLHQMLPGELVKGLPRMELPTILLGRLAVDRSVKGEGLGRLLLIDALRRAQSLVDQIGIRAVEVDAIDDAARQFYVKFGFQPLLDDVRHLILPMQAIRKLGLSSA